MKQIKQLAILLIASLGLSQNAFAEEKDKSIYNLFNPVPEEQMRELSTDRPDKTESAYTIDAGHFQMETDIITYTRNYKDSVLTNDFAFNVMNLKAGLTNFMDLQLVVPSYLTSSTQSKDKNTFSGSFGEITARLKLNICGNEGDNAVGIMPFIKLPTASGDFGNKYLEGGVILPLAFTLPYDFSLGSMLEWDYSINDNSTGYINSLIASLTVSHQLYGDLSGYVEIFSDKNLQSPAWVATFDAGLTYQVTKNIQFDFGANTGLTPEADSFNPFLGFSIRL